jgi:serine/threonine protein kinase
LKEHVRFEGDFAHIQVMDHTALEQFFGEIIDLPVDDRLAALDALGLEDGPLRSEVLRLLRDAEAADAYFTGGGVAVRMLPQSAAPLPAVEGEGDMVGPYRLVRKLGTGGFGVVWQAEQEKPLRRTVALKVLKAGMDSAEVLARFDAEKQALARMDHLNIAKVLDAGISESGRSYFAMELVEGCPVTQFCEENAIPTRDRLKLFMDVCAAVTHAHQKGVIHRDLKPSNVLVSRQDSGPVVKVIDFGIAKAIEGDLTDQTLLTRAEQWIGTPIYMSPEQVGMGSADLDTRSDIYALGVILYELITGCPPFDSETLMRAGYEEMRRIIREEDPPRPSARITTRRDISQGQPAKGDNSTDQALRSIKSELDWIVMKAIEKSKERRYNSAAALADDLGRFLADEPISAKPPSSAYLIAKFARRNRGAVRSLLGLSVILVAAVVFSTWQAMRARDAERIAQERLATALKDRSAKNQALEEAESVSRLLAEVFQRPQPGVDGRSVTVLQALDTAVEKLDAELAKQPERQTTLRGVLAETYERLGIFERSLALREKNFETSHETFGPSDPLTGIALRKVVEVAEAMGDGKAALRYALLENEALRKANATSEEIGISMQSLIRAWFGMGNREKAIAQQREYMDFCIQLYGVDSPQSVNARWELRQYEARMQGVSSESIAQGEPQVEKSKEENQDTTPILDLEKDFSQHVEVHGPLHPSTIEVRMALAKKLASLGYTMEALVHFQALQSTTMSSLGPLDERTLEAQSLLAGVYSKLGRLKDAIRSQQLVVSALRERDGGATESTVDAEDRLERYFFYSRLPETADFRKDLLERRIKLFGENHVNTVLLRVEIGADNPADARKNMQNAIRVMRENFGNESRSTAAAIAALARASFGEGRIKEALALYAECAPNMLDDTWVNFECASLQLWTGDKEGFRKTRRHILDYWGRRIGEQKSQAEMLDRAMWLSSIDEFDDDGQKATIQNILGEIVKIREGLTADAKDRHGIALQNQLHGIVLYRLGRYGDALASLEKCASLINSEKKSSGTMHYQLSHPMVHFFMAMTQHRLGNELEAKRLFDLGESMLKSPPPSQENPVIDYIIGGDALAMWICHKEAKELLTSE